MKHITTPLIAALLALSATAENYTTPVKIDSGEIIGIQEDGIDRYLGIPYAAPTEGDQRWTRPVPPAPRDTVMYAVKFGPRSAQTVSFDPNSLYGKEFYADPANIPADSEDCLQLNIWTPADAAKGSRLPVVMWVHGGSFDHGWSHEITMDGTEFARRGVVLVTVNYRVGAPGFMAHPLLSAESADGASGNYGLYDLAEALKWIKNNISAFHGSPDNITVMGQSAGGGLVMDLMASPITSTMISKAIILSAGGASGPTRAEAETMGKQLMDWAGITTTEAMRALTPVQLDSIQQAYQQVTGNAAHFAPFADGVIHPEQFNAAHTAGRLKEMPVMIGYTKDDIPGLPAIAEEFLHTRSMLNTSAPAYAYKFNRALPGDSAGAFHSAELWYVFGTLDRCWRPMTERDHDLSRRMLTYWTNFAKYGNPNGPHPGEWLPYTSKNCYFQILDVVDD